MRRIVPATVAVTPWTLVPTLRVGTDWPGTLRVLEAEHTSPQ